MYWPDSQNVHLQLGPTRDDIERLSRFCSGYFVTVNNSENIPSKTIELDPVDHHVVQAGDDDGIRDAIRRWAGEVLIARKDRGELPEDLLEAGAISLESRKRYLLAQRRK